MKRWNFSNRKSMRLGLVWFIYWYNEENKFTTEIQIKRT